jgi:hypothetical protein
MSSDRRDDVPKESEKPRKRGRTAIKWLIAAIPILAALFGIAASLENWLNGSASAKPGSTPAEYGAVCSLSNTRQREWEQDLAGFRHAFAHAETLTVARDALLRVTEQDIDSTAELRNHIDALTPPHGESSVQRHLERDWNLNLQALANYRERLGLGVGSTRELESIAKALPRSKMETRANEARGWLLKLGSPSCDLEPVKSEPVAQWPQTLLTEGSGGKPSPDPTPGSTTSGPTTASAAGPTTPDAAPSGAPSVVEPPKAPSDVAPIHEGALRAVER